jgi:competence ComEA-like helix-hairpin-helix protein
LAIRNSITQFDTEDDMKQAGQNKIQSFAFVIGVFLAFCFSLVFFEHPGRDKPAFSMCEIKLDSRVNLNNAPIESLVRLPDLGIGRAGAIVAYRDDFNKRNAGTPAFRNCNDLQKVKGIGPKIVQNISEWLRFD